MSWSQHSGQDIIPYSKIFRWPTKGPLTVARTIIISQVLLITHPIHVTSKSLEHIRHPLVGFSVQCEGSAWVGQLEGKYEVKPAVAGGMAQKQGKGTDLRT